MAITFILNKKHLESFKYMILLFKTHDFLGELCIDILKTNWSPAWTMQYLCRGVIYVLTYPNSDSPLNCDAGNLIRSGDLIGYKSMAQMYTHEYALKEFPSSGKL